MSKKITSQNRKFFIKWLPFNFCDRFCERCEDMKDDCKIYKDEIEYKTKCAAEGKDPDDWGVVMKQVGENLGKAMAMIQSELKAKGIKMTKKDEEKYKKERKEIEEKIENHPLQKKSYNLMKSMYQFLKEFYKEFEEKPEVLVSLQSELEEIGFYHHLVAVKGRRGIFSKIEEEKDEIKFSRPDSMVSGALGFFSLKTCQKAFESILNFMKCEGEEKWIFLIDKILRDAKETEKDFKKTFKGVEKYKDKIIFHGEID